MINGIEKIDLVIIVRYNFFNKCGIWLDGNAILKSINTEDEREFPAYITKGDNNG